MSRAALERHIRRTPVDGSPEDMRAAFDTLTRWPDPRELPPLATVGGCAGRWFGQGDDVIVWLHGGGYVFGGSISHAACADYLANLADSRVFVPDYPLAPEHGWPTIHCAVDQVLKALPGARVVGDSAGGHLALVLAQRGADIRRLVLLSPNTDRNGSSQSRTRNGDTDLMNKDAQDTHLAKLAFGDRATDDPEVSPLLGDLTGLPPLMIYTSLTEILLDDSLLLARAAALAGAEVCLRTVPDLFHMWHLWPGSLPEARIMLSDVAAFLDA
ncbi:alpha/beta hydrolase fold domain-containing protein [Loktanella sp. SALINAS62]|uniref:alpha/beta hydrolase fold domain-containing protein n=1 Tax=Loktanella sp. SALINAS62 TaxID=2706124 RepID=UPI001B8BD793|nr:alpha/beta hydrolase fold domain-containing protein [Loktanella sp. SALINAS62]MBS1301132.1 alpha/beta hydrolase [Loktanella sp. SALINAS62]